MKPSGVIISWFVGAVLALFALYVMACAGSAHAAGDIIGSYEVPDTTTCYVYGVLCSDGTCNAKTLWSDAGYGLPVTEGAPGTRAGFRLSLSSAGPQNVTLEIVRESVFTRYSSPRVVLLRVMTQQRADTLMAWARSDTALVAWAQPVPGASPLGTVFSYSFDPWEAEDVMLTTQSAVQWHYRRRLIELFGGYYVGGQWRIEP